MAGYLLCSSIFHLIAVDSLNQTDCHYEIVPVTGPTGKKTPPIEFKVDKHPRETSMEALTALPPAFIPGGRLRPETHPDVMT